MTLLRPSLALILVLTACRGPELEVLATVNAATATVIELAWDTPEEGVSWVEYGTSEDLELSTPWSEKPSTAHHFALFGLPPLAQVYYRAVTEVDGRELSASGEISTLNLPSTLPDVEVTASQPGLISPEPYVMTLLMGVDSAISILDREGEVVWYRELEGFTGEQPIAYGDVRLAQGSTDLVFNQFVGDLADPSGIDKIVRVSLTGEIVDERSTPRAHHAFTQLDAGAYAYVAADVRAYQLPGEPEPMDFVGDAIVVVDQDGSAETVFSTWDWGHPVELSAHDSSLYPGLQEWTHCNDLRWYPEDQTFLLSAGYIQAVLEVDRSSGQVLRQLGPGGDVDIAPGSPTFFFQHEPHWTEDGTLLMVSRHGEEGMEEDWSEFIGVEYQLDQGLLVERWSYGKGLGIDNLAEGMIQRLSNGNTMICWGFTGLCREVTPGGEVAWELQSAAGAGIIGASPLASFYEVE